ncbi:hypothetical protein K438DRAFT_1770859 [Mycena galopus ATCC 62051]|nr:hypothetical protein K438DRAFT_1770859 [Mycena galopus ATCC 62051]
MASSLPSDFIQAVEQFEKLVETAKLLSEYSAAPDKRKIQLNEVGQAAFKFLGFPQQVLARESEKLREHFFDMRGYYHALYNPDKDSKIPYPQSYDSLRQLTFQIQEDRLIKKGAASKKVIKSKAIIDSDESDVELIMPKAAGKASTSTEDPGADQMEVDDEKKASHDIGTVPKGISFKKFKPDLENATQDQTEPSQFTSKATTTSKNKKTSKKRRHLADDDDTTFISAVLKELGYGSSISHVMEEAKLITTMPSDLPNTIPAIKKRLYQFMVEIAVINDRVRSDLALRTAHIEDAAGLTARLTELEGSPAEN